MKLSGLDLPQAEPLHGPNPAGNADNRPSRPLFFSAKYSGEREGQRPSP